MIIINKITPFFCFSVLFYGCISGNNDGSVIPVSEELPTVVTIDEKAAGERSLLYSDFAQSVDFLPLDECQESLIGYVNKIEVTNNGDYIVFDRDSKKIVRFDSLGNFLNLIGGIGHGPKEFVSPISITYNPFTDHVFVNDDGKLTLLEYDLDGELVRSKYPVPFDAQEIGIVDETHYCFYSDFRGNNGNGGFNYHITDTTFQTVGCFEAFQSTPSLGSSSQVFARCNNALIGRSPASNFLYQISVDSITPLYRIEYNGEGQWLSETNPDLLRDKYLHTKNLSHCLNTFVSNNYVIIENSVCSGDCFVGRTAVYDKESGKVLTGKSCINNLSPYCIPSSIKAIHDNKLIHVCFPEEYQREIDTLQGVLNQHGASMVPETKNEFLSHIDHITSVQLKI